MDGKKVIETLVSPSTTTLLTAISTPQLTTHVRSQHLCIKKKTEPEQKRSRLVSLTARLHHLPWTHCGHGPKPPLYAPKTRNAPQPLPPAATK